MECSTECETAGALGKLVAFLASILQRAEILKAEEFADLLAVFAATSRRPMRGKASSSRVGR
jgi:hypothetical protein